MKKIVFTLLFFTLIYGAKAQITGGGQEAPVAVPNSPKNAGLYFKAGISTPGSDLKANNFKSGYIAEFGFLMNFDQKKRIISGGVIIADDYAFYKREIGDGTTATETLSFLGIKVGPAIHINPAGKLYLTAYYAVHGGWTLGKYYGIEQTDFKTSFMNAFGINLKYRPFIIGMEFDSGSMKLQGNTELNFPTTRLTFGFSM